MIFPEIRTFMPENSKSGDWMSFPEISHNRKIEISKKWMTLPENFSVRITTGKTEIWKNIWMSFPGFAKGQGYPGHKKIKNVLGIV